MAVTSEFADRLERLAPGSLRNRAIDRLALAHDASHYLMTSMSVVTVRDQDHLAGLVQIARESGIPVTFRSGGTSLSGQASTEGLLLDTRRNFRQIEVLDGGDRVRVQPGATVRQANLRLARHKRRLGPDPASEVACTLGGVIANNSSGMSCGTEFNTYNTIESAVLVLANGAVVNTGAADADDQLRQAAPDLWSGLIQLRDEVRSNPGMTAAITQQYALKNTMGYGVNAFVDHDSAVEILLHLVVGSEGTLAFVAEATLRTVPVHPQVATGMLYFRTLADATGALPALVASGPATVELLDATSLRVAQRDPGADEELLNLTVDQHAALLIEYQEQDREALMRRLEAWDGLAEGLPLARPATLTEDATRRNALWHIRKDLYATVAGNRPSGTTALLEDIAVPVAALRPTCEGLIELFERHGYQDSVIFGHAKDGNIHFMLTADFEDPAATQRYAEFTEQMVELVLRHNGTLKAEHGTGRVMAPYVRRQFGDEIYQVMLRVKNLADPAGLLNPGILLNEDQDAPLRNLKRTPTVEIEVDQCVECGYCESVCPSKDLTLTPRERIVLRRERESARLAGDRKLVEELDRDYGYDGVDTCAADGMCQSVCPVGIDTGKLVKRLRAEHSSSPAAASWSLAARKWGPVTRAAAAALNLAKVLPAPLVTAATDGGRTVLGADVVPRYERGLPGGGAKRRPQASDEAVAVYVPSCIGSMFGPADDSQGVHDAFLDLCDRADVHVLIPEGVDAMCCGTPWTSKGNVKGHHAMSETVLPSLLHATRNGQLPLVSDGVSCTEGFVNMAAGSRLTVIDAVAFVEQEILPKLTVTTPIQSLAVHPTCSSTHLGVTQSMLTIAGAVSAEVVVPDNWGCCGFAGDRGLLHPELTASATRAESAEVVERAFSAYASANRTCELGMTRATGKPYRHILELLDDATRA